MSVRRFSLITPVLLAVSPLQDINLSTDILKAVEIKLFKFGTNRDN